MDENILIEILESMKCKLDSSFVTLAGISVATYKDRGKP